MNDSADGVLTLARLKVINANAVSGPFTWGFPAITAFTGFAHALGRHLQRSDELDLEFELDGVGVICHHHRAQATGKFEKRLHLTRNPLTSAGKSPSFVEEGRIDLEISLIIQLRSDDLLAADEDEDFPPICRFIERHLQTMRIAGGSICPQSIQGAASIDLLNEILDERKSWWRKHRRQLLPGFALVDARQKLVAHVESMQEQDQNADELDALLDFTGLYRECRETDGGVKWEVRSQPGWYVPIPVGYSAISPVYEPGEVTSARDMTVPFRFVETAYSLGQWLSPHRVAHIDDLFWSHEYDPQAELYLCTNNYPKEMS